MHQSWWPSDSCMPAQRGTGGATFQLKEAQGPTIPVFKLRQGGNGLWLCGDWWPFFQLWFPSWPKIRWFFWLLIWVHAMYVSFFTPDRSRIYFPELALIILGLSGPNKLCYHSGISLISICYWTETKSLPIIDSGLCQGNIFSCVQKKIFAYLNLLLNYGKRLLPF